MHLIESPINYMGSKYKLLDRLIPLFPKAKTFVDLFSGGGSVYININHLYEEVIANEYINGVYQIHKNLKDKNFIQEAINHSIITKDSQENYSRLRDAYNIYNKPEKLLALIWSCNSNMMRFNNKFEFNQTWGQRCFNKNTQKKLDNFWEKDFSNVTFINVDFASVIIPLDSFIYLDPPYSNTEAGYNSIWNNKQEEELIRYLNYFIKTNQPFGVSGCINNKPNKIYEFLIKQENLKVYYFEDLYQKISKKEKVNKEYYFTNIQS